MIMAIDRVAWQYEANQWRTALILSGPRGRRASLPGLVTREERRLKQLRQVAELIRAARQRAGLTQDDLAARMTEAGEPTSRSQVSMWEMGREGGYMPSTAKLLTIFEVTRTADPARAAAERQMAELEDQLAELRRRLDR
jgi:transcriptional regulator with XRE-family HTH domain